MTEPERTATIAETLAEAAEEPTARNLVFAAPADDPRARRPADVVKLIGYTLVTLLAAWSHAGESDVDRRVLEFFEGGLPGWISATFTTVFILGGVYAVGLLLAITVFGKGRGAIARDMLAAAVVALVLAQLLATLTGPEWIDVIPEVLERNGFPSFPLARLTLTVAVLSVAGPYLALPMRVVGRRLLWGMALAGLVMGYGTVSAIIGAAALGGAAAASVRLVFGSGVGIPSKARIIDGLRSAGIEAASLDYWAEQPVGVTVLDGDLADGSSSIVKVYGRDAADAELASRLWRVLFFRDFDRALTATNQQQVEHESLMLYEAGIGGAPVPGLIGWGRSETGDAFLVTSARLGPSMLELAADDISDDALAACWDGLSRLHAARIAHGALDRLRITVAGDEVVLRDLSAARVTPDENARKTDIAQMLVATSVAVGADRAIAAARSALGDDRLGSALPLLQASALSSELQRDARDAGIKLKELRTATAEAIDTESPELVQLARVTWGNVAMVALTLFAAYALLSALADIGFDTIAEQVADAEWSWIAIAFILAQLTNVGEYVSLTGVVRNDVPFGPTIMFRYALSFIGLAVPSDAGAIAMNIRYMQKLGESTAAAVAQGPLLTVFSKGFDIILLLIAGRVIGETVDLDDLDSGPVLRLLLLVLILAVIGIVVVLSVKRYRDQVVPPIKEAFASIRASVTDPQRLLRIAFGTLMQKILFAMTLSAAVAAYGGELGFSQALFVNTAISLFVGLMPVPGGVGVAEAALTAGLTAVGIPQEVAVAAAITHRMVTAYIPPIFGFFASNWLTERDYL